MSSLGVLMSVKEPFGDLESKAKNAGAPCASSMTCVKSLFAFVYPAVAWNAKYEGRYLLGTSLARPVIASAWLKLLANMATAIAPAPPVKITTKFVLS